MRTQEELVKYLRKDCDFSIRVKLQNKYRVSSYLNVWLADYLNKKEWEAPL